MDPDLTTKQLLSISEILKVDASWAAKFKYNYNIQVKSLKPLDERTRHFATRTTTYSRRCSTTGSKRAQTLLLQCIRSNQYMGHLDLLETLQDLFLHFRMAFLRSTTACKAFSIQMSAAKSRLYD